MSEHIETEGEKKGNEEYKNEKTEPPKREEKPIVIFVATYPNEKGAHASFLDELEKAYTVLHPSFDYEGEVGMSVRLKLPSKEVPWDNKPWKRIIKRDYWGIQQSNLIVYDLDSNPGDHFIAAAFLQGKQVLGVSETLRGVVPYFSSCVSAVVRPEDLHTAIKTLLELK
jgi:hypothetical protein